MTKLTRIVSLIALFTPLALGASFADEAIPNAPELRWWKGNIHTHSFWSDGTDFPEMIAEWYRARDYNFLALSDHNVLSQGVRWMKRSEILSRAKPDVIEKYRARFGGGWVETRGEPGAPDEEIRLKPLGEFRALVEQRGQFIMLQGEEISDRSQGVPVHLNATNIQEVIDPLGGATTREAITNNLRAVQDQARRTGQPILLHLNHPNFGYAITAEDLAAVVNERFFEVYNGHPGINHLGDARHPGDERLWDIANTIRLGELGAAPLYGVATDDSHEYHGRPGSQPGRGWIMVRSRYLTPEHLIRAIRAAEFYASSGVVLEDVQFDSQTKQLEVRVNAEPDASYQIEFIGTRVDYDRTKRPRTDAEGRPMRATHVYSSDIGQVLATTTGSRASYSLRGDELYVRAVVTSSKPHPNPSFPDQRQQAWTQPVGWDEALQ